MLTSSHLHVGAAYCPEHWAEDLCLMQEAGFAVVRMAEFAWSALDPAEGKFHPGWHERAITILSGADIVSALATPWAAQLAQGQRLKRICKAW
jgi:beta-galactosidase